MQVTLKSYLTSNIIDTDNSDKYTTRASFGCYINEQQYFSYLHSSDTSTLDIIKEPEEDDKLRCLSQPVQITDELVVFMKEYLLPTMYAERGIGIASIQVGLPIRALIVDIPIIQSIGNQLIGISKSDPRYARNAVQRGSTVQLKERQVVYSNGAMSHFNVERILRPVDIESDGIAGAIEVHVERRPIFIINPEVESVSTEEVVIEEGCLSVPAEYVKTVYGNNTRVKRPLGIRISYTDLDGKRQVLDTHHFRRELGWSDDHVMWLARCIQHEYDHLEGILFTDKLYDESET